MNFFQGSKVAQMRATILKTLKRMEVKTGTIFNKKYSRFPCARKDLMGKNKTGVSDADNEMAGRLLLMGVFAIAMVFLLAVSPILIGGFLIGLIWYGAYMEDGEPNGLKLFWPIAITLALFIYWLGLPPPVSLSFEGVLFTDLRAWTGMQVTEVIKMVNEWLPRKHAIRSVTFQQVRIYLWLMFSVAIGVCTWLHFKGAGRGVFLYRGVNILFEPLRQAAIKREVILGLVGFSIASLILGFPMWLKMGFAMTTALMTIYYLTKKGFRRQKQVAPQIQELQHKVEKRIEKVPVGIEKGHSFKKLTLTDEQLNHHVHIVGASGFGKSVLLSHIIKNRIDSGHGVLFVDLKADIDTIRQVVSRAAAAGRLDDLRIFSCGNPDISHPYNVLANGTANQLRDRIMGALNWSEDFYKNEASSFLLKILLGLTFLRKHKNQPFDLGTILSCIKDQHQIVRIIDELPESLTEVRKELDELHRHLAKSENLRALQGLKSQLESLLLSDFGHLLKAHENGIDLFDAIKNQKIVYLLLDSRTYGESSRSLGKLILEDLKAASARVDGGIEKEDRKPFSVIIDEFADLATGDFIGFIDRARSSGIGVVVAHQEIADLDRVSPEFGRSLMNCTSTMFAFLQKLPGSSELIAGIAGTRKTREVTEQAETDWLFGEKKTGMKSIKEVDEFVIHPNVIRSLQVGECVMVQKHPNSKAFIVRVHKEDKNYLRLDEVNRILGALKKRYGVDTTEIKPVSPKVIPVRARTVREQEPIELGKDQSGKSMDYWSDKMGM